MEVILRTDGAGLRHSRNALGLGVAVTNRTEVLLFLLIRLAEEPPLGSPDGVKTVGRRAQPAHRKADLSQQIVDGLGKVRRQANDPAVADHGLRGPGGSVRLEVQLLQAAEEVVATSYERAAPRLAVALGARPVGQDLVRDRAVTH